MKKINTTILGHLRNDGRMCLTTMSRKIGMPVSTIHEKLKQYKAKGYVQPSLLLNFEKMGFTAHAHILLRVRNKHKPKLFDFLNNHKNVNRLYQINNGWNLLAEVVFKNMKELEKFVDKLKLYYY